MITPISARRVLNAQGITFRSVGGKLVLSPRRLVTSETLRFVSNHKFEIKTELEYLNAHPEARSWRDYLN